MLNCAILRSSASYRATEAERVHGQRRRKSYVSRLSPIIRYLYDDAKDLGIKPLEYLRHRS